MRPKAPRSVRPRLAGCALLVLAVVLAPAAAGDSSDALRSRDSALAAKSRTAVLSLYAIESELSRARGKLAAIEERARAVRHERQVVGLQLGIARRGVRVSQGRLAKRLRAIYERGDIDPVAIVLGADSLDSALTGLDSIGQMASGDHAVVEQVRSARHSLTGLRARLAERQRKLDGLVAAAAATARSLEATAGARRAYVAQLANERRLNQAAIARIESRARAARVKSQTLELTVAPPAQPVVDVERTDASATPSTVSGTRSISVTATGYVLPGTTATGIPVGWGVAAVDPAVIPLGTHFTVPGYGEAVAADIGGAVRGASIDLWFPTLAQAHAWGRRSVTIDVG